MKKEIKITMPTSKTLLEKVKSKAQSLLDQAVQGAGPLGGKLGRVGKKFLFFPFKVAFIICKGLLAYGREFFYIRSGGFKFDPSSKKFWAQMAHVAFFTALYLKFFGTEQVAARISDSLVGILAGHAVAAMGWYAMGKQKDIDNSVKNNTAATANLQPGTIIATPDQEASVLSAPKK